MNALYATNIVITQQGKSYVLTFESNNRMTAVRVSPDRAEKLIAELSERIVRDRKNGVFS